MMRLQDALEQVRRRWPGEMRGEFGSRKDALEYEMESPSAEVPELCGWLFKEAGYNFATLIPEERESGWELRYVFYGDRNQGVLHVLVRQPIDNRTFLSLIGHVHAADWNEREAEDLFGLSFEGHPRLGDFVLHDDHWPEAIAPMQRSVDGRQPLPHQQREGVWQPLLVLDAPGAFAMPIGPIYSGVAESALFLLETTGEDVVRAVPRLFYKYRGIEKIAEGRSVQDALLLAERANGTCAFAHGFAYCRAAEAICGAAVPDRARMLRLLLAELERLRHHAGAIREICESTSLAVATSQASIPEEELLSLSCSFAGHRYLFGLNTIGGLTRDFESAACLDVAAGAADILRRLDKLEEELRYSSSFLDRLEQVGMVSNDDARTFGLVGPIARASGVARDLRRLQPYSGYERMEFAVPCEQEGDGYARLRILFAEARQSLRIIQQAVARLPGGPVCQRNLEMKSGAALGWTEAPRGAAFHWLRVGQDGMVQRCRLASPSLNNWNGFHLAAEGFAFQDFPIIMASFGLSVAENDR